MVVHLLACAALGFIVGVLCGLAGLRTPATVLILLVVGVLTVLA